MDLVSMLSAPALRRALSMWGRTEARGVSPVGDSRGVCVHVGCGADRASEEGSAAARCVFAVVRWALTGRLWKLSSCLMICKPRSPFRGARRALCSALCAS